MVPRTDIVTAYITCPTLVEARAIGRVLVEEQLAACVNLRAHEAIYRWQGTIETAPEYAVLAKTTQSTFPRLRERVLAMHSASLPCVVAFPVIDGHLAFLDWIASQTS